MAKCSCGNSRFIDKGRAFDGRRSFRCNVCRRVWTEGTNGRAPKYSPQREGYQFADTGASKFVPSA